MRVAATLGLAGAGLLHLTITRAGSMRAGPRRAAAMTLTYRPGGGSASGPTASLAQSYRPSWNSGAPSDLNVRPGVHGSAKRQFQTDRFIGRPTSARWQRRLAASIRPAPEPVVRTARQSSARSRAAGQSAFASSSRLRRLRILAASANGSRAYQAAAAMFIATWRGNPRKMATRYASRATFSIAVRLSSSTLKQGYAQPAVSRRA
jgi:hypothetical protein